MKTLLKISSKLLAVILLLTLFTSCHSKYISLDYKIYHNVYCNKDSTLVAFMAETRGFLHATGIARFPDGGQSKVIYKKTDIFIFNIEDSTRVNVLHLNDLSLTKGHILASPKTTMCFADSILLFRITPATGWDYCLKFAQTASDSAKIENLKSTYSKPFLWNFSKQEVWQIDSMGANSICSANAHASLTKVYNFVKKVPLKDLGLDIMKIFPKTEREYIEETIYLKNDSRKSRRAVVEQIISKLSKEDIRTLLLEMDQYQNTLEDSEKTEYRIFSKDTYEQIKALL